METVSKKKVKQMPDAPIDYYEVRLQQEIEQIDEEYEQRMNKKKRSYKTARSRAPWIPVW